MSDTVLIIQPPQLQAAIVVQQIQGPTGGGGSGPPGNYGVNVVTYGGDASGVNDSTAAFVAASAAALADQSGLVYVPVGIFKLSSDQTITAPLFFAPGGSIAPIAGKTVSLSGNVHAGDYQSIFTGAGTVVPKANSYLSVCWYGADNTAVADSASAFQATVTAASLVTKTTIIGGSAPAPPIVWLPPGVYGITKSTVINTNFQHILGAGAGNTVIQSMGLGTVPCFVGTTPDGGACVSTSLATGPGNSFDLDATAYAGTIHNYMVPVFESIGLHSDTISSLTAFSCRFFFKPTSLPAQIYSMTGIFGSRSNDERALGVPADPFYIYTDNTLQVTAVFHTSAGTGGSTNALVMAVNSIYEIEFSWDGTNARLFVGLVGGGATTVSTTAVGGTFSILPYHQCSIGRLVSTYPDGSSIFNGFGLIDSVEYRKAAVHTAAFVPQTTKHTGISGTTLWRSDFELTGPNNEIIIGYDINERVCNHVSRVGRTPTVIGAFNIGLKLEGFETQFCPIYAQRFLQTYILDFYTRYGGYGVFLQNNCFDSVLQRLIVDTVHSFGAALTSASGVTSVSDASLSATGFGMCITDAGGSLQNVYSEGQYCGYLLSSSGSLGLSFTNCTTTDEGAAGIYDCGVYISGNVAVAMNGCVLEANAGTQSLIRIGGNTARVTANACVFNAGPLLKDRIHFYNAAPVPGMVTIINPANYSGSEASPWSNVGGIVNLVNDNGARLFKSVAGVSGTAVERKDIGIVHTTGATLTGVAFSYYGSGTFVPLTDACSSAIDAKVQAKGPSFTWVSSFNRVFARAGASVLSSVGGTGAVDSIGTVPVTISATLGFTGTSWFMRVVGASGAPMDTMVTTSLSELP